MINSNRDDFDSYESLEQYWLKEDALRSLDYDVYFSLSRRYYCDAGCRVCYIENNFKDTKEIGYEEDLETLESEWFKFFEYFGVVRTNDDLYYMKYNYPKQYAWYQKHGKNFELCITDNAIFRLEKLDDIELASLGDVSISTDFLNHVGVEKVLQSVKNLYDNHGIKKIKYIDCGHPEVFADVIKWANEFGLHNCVHHDFRTNNREILNHAWAEYQNTWVSNSEGHLYQIYRESVHLYYDRFYFSSDDASNIHQAPFYIFEDKIDIKQFMYNMVIGKQQLYSGMVKAPVEKKFRDYYKATQSFTVNENFNFIPVIMFPTSSKFFYRLEEDGWIRTKYGMLLQNNEKVRPIIS